MACPDYLKQHVLRNGVPQTLQDLLEYVQELKEIRQQRASDYEADEKDDYEHRNTCNHCEALEKALSHCNETT